MARGTLGTPGASPFIPVAGLNTYLNVQLFGAFGNGVADDTEAIQAAADQAGNLGGATVFFPPGTYLISTGISVSSNTHVLGVGNPTLKLSASSSTGRILSMTDCTDVTVEGLTFDGNRANAPFGNVCQVSQGTRVTWRRCRWTNTKGIALLHGGASGCHQSGAADCWFEDCGRENYTTGSSSDRRQAVAFSGNGTQNFVNYCNFIDIGLDSISFDGGEERCQVVGNTLLRGSGIYVSEATHYRVIGNLSQDADEVAIDTVDSQFGVISGNICEGARGSGILIAGTSEFVTVADNIVRNNGQANAEGSVPAGLVAQSWKAGVSFGLAVRNITLRGNVVLDDQGSPTQTSAVAVGTPATSWTADRDTIVIDDSNILLGTDRFETVYLGGLETWQTFTLADGAEMVVCASGLRCYIEAVQLNSAHTGRFFLNLGPIQKIYGASWETTDTGTTNVLYRDLGDSTVKIKNRSGGSRVYRVRIEGMGGVTV